MTATAPRLDHPPGDANVYVWPFGVAVVHLVEHLEFASLERLAVWRRSSYRQARAWADTVLTGSCAYPDDQLIMDVVQVRHDTPLLLIG